MSHEKTLNFADFRARVGDLRGKEYWRSLEELSRSEVFDEFMSQEFPQQAQPLQNGANRRDFLRLMSASVAMAGLAACKQPAEVIVPYVNQPENLIPGKPLFFASAMPLGGVATGVLVESHMNRPTKIEGNPDHPSSLGATDAFIQAAVLGLYDPDRSQVVRRLGDTVTWADFLGALQPVINDAKTNGAGLRILTQTITSPTLGAQMQTLMTLYPGMKWHQWEAVNRDNVREGARMAFGGPASVRYDFTKANVVVSLGADFLGEGPGHLRYARDYMSRRRVRQGETKSIIRLYAIEASVSQSGSVADHRLPVRPSQIAAIAREILSGQGGSAFVQALVKDLQANRGASVVIAGDDQPAEVHAVVHAINSQLGNIGSTVVVTDPVEVMPVNQLASLTELVRDMNAGAVKALVILGGNPVFDAPVDLQFAAALDKVPLRAHHSLYYDETSMRCHWHVPDTHWLESWGDARGHDGTVSIIQPLIAPLYNGRSVHEVLGALIGGMDQTPYQSVRAYWLSTGATEESWRKWLHDGLIAGTALTLRAVAAAAPPATDNRQPPNGAGIELELRPDPTIYDGRFANNGWLQELPKPHTKITWDNVMLVGPKTAEAIGYPAEEREENVNNRRTLYAKVTYRGVSMRLPVWVVPGYADNVATVYFGYGRKRAGSVGNGKGFNTYPFRFSNGLHGGPGAKIEIDRSRGNYPVACTQEHQSIDPKVVGERGLIRSATFTEYQHDPDFVQNWVHHGDDLHGDLSMYPPYDYSKQHAWAMVIDTSVCTGCNGCMIACQAENNIAIVGKEQVVRERELHWLRVDRYYRGDADNPEVFHQPVPCMQCEAAPCEPVCPVEATSHSEDGLNDMTYNRCVGTRYCSNNCPYKVRRFNFFHYADYDTPALKPMRNPDVTVRTRGVMEKCTYCVQRINHAKIEAEKEGRRVRDGEIVTACQQACPTEAIVFGDMNDPTSKVAKLKAEPTNYALLEELQTRPRTTYLGHIGNPNTDLKPPAKTDTGHEG